jgi:3-phosphoshikimate 1-carboxyvinyltransferase
MHYDEKSDTLVIPCVYLPAQRERKTIKITVPGSKSITNRALLLAAIGNGKTTLKGVLFSDDTKYFIQCLNELGFETKIDTTQKIVEVNGTGGTIPKKSATLYVGSAGTAARFLTAFLAFTTGIYRIDASEQMKKRPMAPLIEALQELGCNIDFHEKEGYFPFTIHGNGIKKNTISVNIDKSSQFLSALLIASSTAPTDMEIEVTGTHGMSYINMTIKMMRQFGLQVIKKSNNIYQIPAKQQIQAQEYSIEPDVSGACYFYALALILGQDVQIQGIHLNSLQGDVALLKTIEAMGAILQETETGVHLSGPPNGIYTGIEVDMSAFSDQAITLAAIAVFATSKTVITGIGHIRYQECDRIKAITQELKSLGIKCKEEKNTITIHPGTPQSGCIKTYEDHRMAMGFALLGLRSPGITIKDPNCCRKTFANYFQLLQEAATQINSLRSSNLSPI